jgi:hypothetical protein
MVRFQAAMEKSGAVDKSKAKRDSITQASLKQL